MVTQNTFKVCLGTFDFNCSLFFIYSNKKEKDTLPNFRLLDEPELPESFPHRHVLILACYKLVVSLWIPDKLVEPKWRSQEQGDNLDLRLVPKDTPSGLNISAT